MKAIIIILFVFIPFLVKGQCNEPTFEFLSAEVNGDSVVLKDNMAERNCGARYKMDIFSLNNNTFVWVQRDTGSIFVCLCHFNLSVTIDSLNAGNYSAMVYYTLPDSPDSCYLGTVSFTITEPNSGLSPYIKNKHQSSCIILGVPTDNKLTDIAIKIYPNPTDEMITIETSQEGLLSILNVNGRELLKQEIIEPSTIIDVGTLPSGIYVVKVIGKKGVQVGKFIKQ